LLEAVSQITLLSANRNGALEVAFPLHAYPGTEKETMDHSQHVRLSDVDLNETTLKDATIYGSNDEKIGSVSHLHGAGPSAQVVVDVGGFLGIGAKPVAIALSQLDVMRDEGGDVHAVTTLTKDQVKVLPEHKD
jgi:hypothetical protein